MYAVLDIAFLVFHLTVIVFLMTGWAVRSLRRLHLVVITLTLASWFGLGMFYGFGYCPSTDWHWQIKRALGETDLPASFIKYWLDKTTGRDLDPRVVDRVVAVAGLAVFVASVGFNRADRQQRHRADRPSASAPDDSKAD